MLYELHTLWIIRLQTNNRCCINYIHCEWLNYIYVINALLATYDKFGISNKLISFSQ